MTRTLLIDTDTASDDAVALIMALRSKEVRVAAITVVAGNVPVAQATSNALYTAELCGADVPVYSGAQRPLLRELKLAASVRRCVVMGGAPCCVGNVTPAAEFNIWVDPEAARIVFHSGLPIEMVGWQLCRGDAVLDPQDIERVLALKNPIAEFAIRCNSTAVEAFFKQTGQRGISLPDPVCMGIALDPTLCTSSSEHHVGIEVSSELTRGMTVVDQLGVAADFRNRDAWASAMERGRKVHICWSLDISRWKRLLLSALA